jgi:copper resistance protein B
MSLRAALLIAASASFLPANAFAQDHSMHNMPGMEMPPKPKPPQPKPKRKPVAKPVQPVVVNPESKSPASDHPAQPAEAAAAGQDHAGMDHGSMPDMDMGQPDAGAEPVGGSVNGEPVGTDLAPGSAEPPPLPKDHFADRFFPQGAMAQSRDQMMREQGGKPFGLLALNIFEYQAHTGRDGYRWDGEGWYGGDINRLWFKSEGEGEMRRGLDSGEVQVLYSRAVDPYFNLQAGVRQDIGRGPKRTYATLGFEGLAPGFFEVEGALFLSNKGDLLGRLEGYYDQRITQRLILQPRLELNFAAQDVPENDVGSGLVDFELGARLRYEFSRQFGPYIGVSYLRKTGETARLSRAAGEDIHATSFVAGVRFWF